MAKAKAEAIDPGEQAVRFINRLTHTGDFSGQPFRLRPWQESIVRQLFGTLKADGSRQYRKMFLAIPRKQGKTELAAAILLYLMLGTGRKGQELYSASGDRAQASLIFRAAAAMVENDPELSRYCKVFHGGKRIDCDPLGSRYEALSSDAPRKHGLGPAAVIFDEVHVLPDRRLHDVLTTGFGARREPLTLYISTAGWDRHSLCWELWNYARRVRDGLVDDPTFLPILYEAAPDADWKSDAVWREVMPALGDFCSLEFIRDECRNAQELPAYENTFKQLFLDLWTEQAKRWISMDAWDACRADFTEADFEGRECYGGLDLSSVKDLTALVLPFPNELGGYDLLPYFWLPGESIAHREKMDRIPYSAWCREGLITKTEGKRIDYDAIRDFVEEKSRMFRILSLGYDPMFAGQIANQLYRDGNGIPIQEVPNNLVHMHPASREFERLVVEGKIRHPGNAVLDWNVSNAATVERSQMIMPAKARSTGRIDGVTATVMGLAVAMGGAESEADEIDQVAMFI